MATTVTGSISTGQIAKKAVSDAAEAVSIAFESQRKDQLTVAVYNKGAGALTGLEVTRVLQDGTTSTESSHGALASGAGVTFVFSYNVPKFQVNYSTAAAATVLVEVDNGSPT